MPQTRSWSFSLFSVRGIPIRVHFTFFLLLLWVGLDASHLGADPTWEILVVLGLFACVLLHELGHALTARVFNVRTRDIILYPFGGIATLLSETTPKAEFIISLAGPMVNVILMLLLYPFSNSLDEIAHAPQVNYFSRLFIANAVLAIFNLIPAFPLDGGRALRALLLILGVKSATAIATRISQVLSLGLAGFALYSENPILLVIAALVVSTAMREHARDKAFRAASGFKVKDVMLDVGHLLLLPHGTTVSQALPQVIRTAQNDFPVMCADNLLGILHRETLLEAAAIDPDESYISELARRDFLALQPDADLASVTDVLQRTSYDSWPVTQDKKLVGLLTRETLNEFLLIQTLRNKTRQEAKKMDSEEGF